MPTELDAGIDALLAAERWEPSFPMELDKIPGFWVMTGWPPENEMVLRLRFAHTSAEDPTEVTCEARMGQEDEFLRLRVTTSVWDLSFDTSLGIFDEGEPSMWRAEFREMARRWATAAFILEYGASAIVRYPHEPVSSRDAIQSGEAFSDSARSAAREPDRPVAPPE